MYDYDNSEIENTCRYVNKLINEKIGSDSVYRVILRKGIMILIFNSLDERDKFVNKNIPKFTCDTSVINVIGNLSLAIKDKMIIERIISSFRKESTTNSLKREWLVNDQGYL